MRKRLPTALAFTYILAVLFRSRIAMDASSYAIALFGGIAIWEVSRLVIKHAPRKEG